MAPGVVTLVLTVEAVVHARGFLGDVPVASHNAVRSVLSGHCYIGSSDTDHTSV